MFSPASMSACSLSAFLSNPAIGPSRLRAAGQIFPRDEPCEGATGQLMTPVCENALLHVIPHMIPVRFVRESDEALSPCKHRHPCNSFTATERIRKNARFFSLRAAVSTSAALSPQRFLQRVAVKSGPCLDCLVRNNIRSRPAESLIYSPDAAGSKCVAGVARRQLLMWQEAADGSEAGTPEVMATT
jgi:hypothetical protein